VLTSCIVVFIMYANHSDDCCTMKLKNARFSQEFMCTVVSVLIDMKKLI